MWREFVWVLKGKRMLRVLAERIVLHRCGIVCLFGRLAEGIWQYKWTGWVQIGKEIVSDWCDRKLSINLGMEKNFKI